ncbi:MAG: radical SAM protein [Nanoarchaeota archaeon]|nr:radical SAM protein [Nanoarchaeota archaeon]
MADTDVRLEFQDFRFEEQDDYIRAHFLKIFFFDIPISDLAKIAEFDVEKHAIIFKHTKQHKAENRFNYLISIGFSHLKNKISGKNAVYIHRNSGIPLIGTNYFGLVDRDTNIIEIKPVTSCNIDCIYCSVAQEKRSVDFVVEKDYLVEEFKKLARHKNLDTIEAHIGGQGEPLLYGDIIELIRGISKVPGVKTISIDTNGTLLSEKLIDDLADAGLTRINLSINAMDPELAKKISSFPLNIERIKLLAKYIASKIDLVIAPVLVQGINDKEIPKIIQFAKEIKQDHEVWMGIQNFLSYRFGRNPAKQMEWDDFFALLKNWEDEFDVNLTKIPILFIQSPKLPRPFKKGNIIKAELVCKGRFRNEMLAVAHGRVIAIPNCSKEKGMVRIEIQRSKDNIFRGQVIGG